jgi:hypothetical protein
MSFLASVQAVEQPSEARLTRRHARAPMRSVAEAANTARPARIKGRATSLLLVAACGV